MFFCTILILVLKMRFHVFSFISKKKQRFSSDRKILILLLSMIFIYKTMFQFFEILIFSQDIWGNVHYAPEMNLIS